MKILLTFHPGVQFQRILATLTNLAKENGAAMATKIEVIDSEDDERGEALVLNLRQRGILVENYDEWTAKGDDYSGDPTAPFTLDELAEAQASGRMSAEEAEGYREQLNTSSEQAAGARRGTSFSGQTRDNGNDEIQNGTSTDNQGANQEPREPGKMGDGTEVTGIASGGEELTNGDTVDEEGRAIAAASQQDIEQVLKAEQGGTGEPKLAAASQQDLEAAGVTQLAQLDSEEAKKDVMAEKADGSPVIGDESATGEVIPKQYEGDTDPDSTEDQKQAQADADAADVTDTERTSTGPAQIP